jgi:hypothetical protein
LGRRIFAIDYILISKNAAETTPGKVFGKKIFHKINFKALVKWSCTVYAVCLILKANIKHAFDNYFELGAIWCLEKKKLHAFSSLYF